MVAEKGPGWDWLVTYEGDGAETETMTVFGCLTIEDATNEARRSLNALEPFTGIILKAERM